MSNALASRLRIALEARGRHKLYAVADEIGVNPSSLTRWLQGGYISLERAVQLCDTLDISLDWLLLGRGSIDPPEAVRAREAEERLVRLFGGLPPAAARALMNLLEILIDLPAGGPSGTRSGGGSAESSSRT